MGMKFSALRVIDEARTKIAVHYPQADKYYELNPFCGSMVFAPSARNELFV